MDGKRSARAAALFFMTAVPVFATACDESRSEKQGTTQKSVRTISVAAASSVRYALDEITAEFQRDHPDIHVATTYGSSGNFFAQISNNAPFDLFLSADDEYPRKLVDAGFAESNARFAYAVGRLVVWIRSDSPIDSARGGAAMLTHSSVRKIAIANPTFAPYGRAAESAIKKLGVEAQTKERLVLGDNVAQAAQFVDSGAADVGFIALSLAVAPAMKERGRYWLVPADHHAPLRQEGLILKSARDAEATRIFRDVLLGARGRAILSRFGFESPGT